MCNREVIEHLKLYLELDMIPKLIFGVLGALLPSFGLRMFCFIMSIYRGWLPGCRVLWGPGRSGCLIRGKLWRSISVRKMLFSSKRMLYSIYSYLRRPVSDLECELMIRNCWVFLKKHSASTLTYDYLQNRL